MPPPSGPGRVMPVASPFPPTPLGALLLRAFIRSSIVLSGILLSGAGLPTLAAPAANRNILFLAGPKSHGPGEHEFPAGSLLLADALNRSGLGITAQVSLGWPAQAKAFAGVSEVVIYCDGEDTHVAKGHFAFLDSLNKAGVGITFMHYALVVAKGPEEGDRVLNWLGGYYETYWSVNPMWTASFAALPAHPATSGAKPFTIEDEWYFHMRFRSGMAGVTPLLSAHPPEETVIGQPDGPHTSNPDVRAAVAAGEIQHLAWVSENPGRGRGFGFCGAHFHSNWGKPDFLRLVLDGLVWTAGGNVPVTGVILPKLGSAELQAYLTAKVPPLTEWPVAITPFHSSRPQPRSRSSPPGNTVAADGRHLPHPSGRVYKKPFAM
jgi:hypothetical protein